MGLWLHQGKPAGSVVFHWPSIVDPVINQSSWASAEESNMFFCKQKYAHDQRALQRHRGRFGRQGGPHIARTHLQCLYVNSQLDDIHRNPPRLVFGE
jgi:hypothetical protein